jgi:hypothetical protein
MMLEEDLVSKFDIDLLIFLLAVVLDIPVTVHLDSFAPLPSMSDVVRIFFV